MLRNIIFCVSILLQFSLADFQPATDATETTSFFASLFNTNKHKAEESSSLLEAQRGIESLNLAERVLMAEHFLRTASRLCDFQMMLGKVKKPRKEPLANMPDKRPTRGFVQTIKGYLSWVQRFVDWDGPPSECIYGKEEWTNMMNMIVYTKSTPFASLGSSFLPEKCLWDFPAKEALSAFKRNESMEKCNCGKFKDGAIFAVLNNGENCSLDVGNVERAIGNVLDAFKSVLLKLLEEYKPKIKNKIKRNGKDFAVLLAFLIKISTDNLNVTNSSEETEILKLRNWLMRRFKMLTGLNYWAFCKNKPIWECDWAEVIKGVRNDEKEMEEEEEEDKNEEADGQKWKDEGERRGKTKLENVGIENGRKMGTKMENSSKGDDFNFAQRLHGVHKLINKNAKILTFATNKHQAKQDSYDFEKMANEVARLTSPKTFIRRFQNQQSRKKPNQIESEMGATTN